METPKKGRSEISAKICPLPVSQVLDPLVCPFEPSHGPSWK